MAPVEMGMRRIADHYRETMTRPALLSLGRDAVLCTVLCTDDLDATAYDGSIKKRSGSLHAGGHTVHVRSILYNRETAFEDLIQCVKHRSEDPEVDAMLVYYPTPYDDNDVALMNAVGSNKDVEGLHALNVGYLQQYLKTLDEKKLVIPCTPKAVGKILQYYHINIAGKIALVVNNSLLVGKPLGAYLENLGATVVRAYDQTPPSFIREIARIADIIVTAVPKEVELFDDIKEGAVLINVSRRKNFHPRVIEKCSYYTDKLGSLTSEMAILQTMYAAVRSNHV